MTIDMWYGDDVQTADAISCSFSDIDCEYRGSIFRHGEAIGDYSAMDSVELGRFFAFTGFSF